MLKFSTVQFITDFLNCVILKIPEKLWKKYLFFSCFSASRLELVFCCSFSLLEGIEPANEN